MAYDRFMIAPLTSGLQTDVKRWMIPDDAFATLNNAYVFRGRLRKRFGSSFTGYGAASNLLNQMNSRVAVAIGTTNGSGDLSVTVPGALWAVGQQFSIGAEILTVITAGVTQVMSTTGTSATHTFSTTNGAFVVTGAADSTVVYFYPAQPIMGLTQYQVGSVNNYPSFAFDTQFVYKFAGGRWLRETSGTPIWHGTNSQFFWDCSWTGITANLTSLFVTNFNATVGTPGASDDPLWSYDGSTWAVFKPRFAPAGGAHNTGPYIQTARIILPFKDRLVMLNTIEGNTAGNLNTAYVNRCRFSHNGSPLANNAWYEPNQMDNDSAPNPAGRLADGGGYIDAATEEQIISAEFIKDRLIVYFERSTWELAYTGNQVLPFVWQKINTELGSEATFSTVPFDKEILTVGNTGVHSCNGANVQRIDDKIPQQIFEISNLNQGTTRVAGIRDFYTELVYWTFPSGNAPAANQTYPNRILVYNYKNQSWAFFDDSFTCFSYFQQQQDSTWELSTTSWAQSNFSWNSAVVQDKFRNIIAGNQQGFIVVVRPDVSSNASCLSITEMAVDGQFIDLQVINHNLPENSHVVVNNAQGVTGVNGVIVKVFDVVSADIIRVRYPNFAGDYTGGGTVARVSNMDILSKQWNPYVEKSRNFFLAKIDFGVLRTSAGQVTVDYFTSAAELSLVNESTDNGSILGTNVLETSAYATVPYEKYQDRLWHTVYTQGDGECVQIRIYMSDEQIENPAIAFSDFEVEGLILYCMRTAGRLQ